MTKQEFINKVQLVALRGDWTPDFPEHFSDNRGILDRKGLKVFVGNGKWYGNGNEDSLHFSSLYPPLANVYNVSFLDLPDFNINISALKTPQRIAEELEKRLVNKYEPHFHTAMERIEHAKQVNIRQQEELKAIKAMMAGAIFQEGSSGSVKAYFQDGKMELFAHNDQITTEIHFNITEFKLFYELFRNIQQGDVIVTYPANTWNNRPLENLELAHLVARRNEQGKFSIVKDRSGHIRPLRDSGKME